MDARRRFCPGVPEQASPPVGAVRAFIATRFPWACRKMTKQQADLDPCRAPKCESSLRGPSGEAVLVNDGSRGLSARRACSVKDAKEAGPGKALAAVWRTYEFV